MASYWSRFSKGSGAGKAARETFVDASGLQKRIQLLRRNMPEISRQVAQEMNALLAWRVSDTSPRDTNRFLRGWLLAAKDVGPIPVIIPALRATSRHSEYIKYLQQELLRLETERKAVAGMIDFWYTSKPNRKRGTPAYNKMTSQVRKMDKWIVRVKEELVKAGGDETVLLMDKERGKRNYSTVRVGIYGGEGSIRRIGGKTLVRWHNKEPHATIIERKYGIIRNAMGMVKRAGLVRVKKTLVRELTKSRAA